MKRFMILFLAVVLVFNNMLLAVSAESCEHQWSLKYDPKYNYEYEDDEYHILVDIELHYECKVCGEAKVEYQEGNGALGKHAFTGNKCYSCGYVREEEKHEHNWKLRYDPQYNYEYVDENYHALVDIDLYYKCSECGETKHEVQDGDYELSKHVYSGNVCYTCGYEKSDEAHSENNRRPEMSDETSSTTSPNVTEEPSVSLTPTPTIAPTATPAPEHTHSWRMAYDPWYQYADYDENYHILSKIVLTYACDCGATRTEEQSGNGTLGQHVYTNGVCGTCGHKESTPTATTTPIVIVTKAPEVQPTLSPTPTPTIAPTATPAPEHTHSWRMTYDPWYQYSDYDENYHILSKIVLTYACDCGATKTEEQSGNGTLGQHVYTNGVCGTCGYKESTSMATTTPIVIVTKAPEVQPTLSPTPTPTIVPTATPAPEHTHSWRMTYDPWYQYADYDENYHILSKIVLTYACDCGVVTAEEQSGNGEISEHKFDGQVCVICGHVQELTDSDNLESPTIDGSNEVVSPGTSEEITHICRFEEPYLTWIGAYTECNVQTHTQQRVKFVYCVECGEKHIFSNIAEVVPHTIENGSCKWCKQKVFSTESEVELATAQLDGLKKLSDKLEKIQKNKDSHFTKDAYNSIKSSIQTLQMQYEAVLRGERFIDGIPRYQDDDVLKMFSSLQAESLKSIKLPTSASTKVEVQLENLYIDLENPDNKWYYLVGDLGEQVILGNFSDKSTLGGTALQILVGELPYVGFATDVRDIGADLTNWEWSWKHVAVTSLDVIGVIPVAGLFKYVGDLKVVSKGVELTDDAADILTVAMKHADDVSDLASKSDDVTEIVTKALVKHAYEVGDVSKFTAKNFDDVVKAVKHPDIFSDTALEHIFKGNKSGGFHYEGLADASGKILQITKPANSAGVYEATVEIAGKAKKKPSTFFPKTWTPEQVLDAIEQVLNNPDSIDAARNTYEGTVKGVKIHLNFDTYGKIRSAYPVL